MKLDIRTLYMVAFAICDIDFFMDIPIEIFVSSHTHVFLSVDPNTKKLEYISKYIPSKDASVVFTLEKHSDGFSIRSNKQYISIKDGDAILDDKRFLWDLEKTKFGYTIGKKGKCITVFKEGISSIIPCVDTKDQVFFFRKQTNRCTEEIPKSNDKIIININERHLKN